MSDKSWLINKTPRSVDQLRLWSENPRLNPENEYVRLSDFAEEFTHEYSDKKEFIKLVKSIAEDGFIPADPIVIWKNLENKKYYVAEGNRRVVALKLLRNPEKAPQSIRATIRGLSAQINLSDIEKIYVNVAPSFEDAEWYISQRNSASSLQRRWSSEQQRRWIVELYEKYSGDIEKIISVTKQTKSELESTIRLLKIKDYVNIPAVNSKLTSAEYESAKSYRFPMTILERFFSFSEVRERWGLEYDGMNVNISSNKQSFHNAFAELIKQIIAKEITTRFTSYDLPDMLAKLPYVSFDKEEEEISEDVLDPQEEDKGNTDPTPSATTQPINTDVISNQKRNRLIPKTCQLNTSNTKLKELFNELKQLPFSRKHSISVVLRVFFDLSIMDYIQSEDIEQKIIKHSKRKEIEHISLKQKLNYLKQHSNLNKESKSIIETLSIPTQQYSLYTLNKYIHGRDTHYSDKTFLNGFWSFLHPLFTSLLDMSER